MSRSVKLGRCRWRGLVALAVAAGALSACGGVTEQLKAVPETVVGWFGSSAKIPELPALRAELPVKTRWKASVGGSGNYVMFPLLQEKQVCGASVKGRLTCLDLDTGKERWTLDLKAPLSAGIGTDGRRLLVVTQDSELIAIEPDGKQSLRAQVSGEILAPPRGAGGLIVIRSTDGRVQGLDGETGKRKWSYQRQLPALTIRNQAGVLIDRDRIYAGWPGGKFTALSLEKGAALWEVTVATPKGSTELERIADVISDPMINGERVCVTAFQGRTMCIDRDRGQPLWARDIPSSNTLGFDFKRAYVADDKGVIHGLDRVSGASTWTQEAFKGRVPSGLLSYGDYVWFGDVEGYVHLIDRANGALSARAGTDGSQILLPPLQTSAGVLVATRDGALVMFDIDAPK
ncbi:MAG: outer membrane protein assembly factor BamB [Betaproteobacteria bacterium]|nr:outer membrane protein assembly factor BamB [Betaproteobacteria bacterium]